MEKACIIVTIVAVRASKDSGDKGEVATESVKPAKKAGSTTWRYLKAIFNRDPDLHNHPPGWVHPDNRM